MNKISQYLRNKELTPCDLKTLIHYIEIIRDIVKLPDDIDQLSEIAGLVAEEPGDLLDEAARKVVMDVLDALDQVDIDSAVAEGDDDSVSFEGGWD